MNTRRHAKANLWNNDHGAGKGDKERTNRAAYSAGIAEVQGLGGKVDGLKKIGPGRHRKSYGTPATATVFETIQGKTIIH